MPIVPVTEKRKTKRNCMKNLLANLEVCVFCRWRFLRVSARHGQLSISLFESSMYHRIAGVFSRVAFIWISCFTQISIFLFLILFPWKASIRKQGERNEALILHLKIFSKLTYYFYIFVCINIFEKAMLFFFL